MKVSRPTFWALGCLLVGLAWSYTGATFNLGRFSVSAQAVGQKAAFHRLSTELKRHPLANRFSVRWQEISVKGEVWDYEIQYNRLLNTLYKMSYGVQHNPVMACSGVQDASVHLVASKPHLYWVVVLNTNGCRCQNKVEQMR